MHRHVENIYPMSSQILYNTGKNGCFSFSHGIVFQNADYFWMLTINTYKEVILKIVRNVSFRANKLTRNHNIHNKEYYIHHFFRILVSHLTFSRRIKGLLIFAFPIPKEKESIFKNMCTIYYFHLYFYYFVNAMST